MRTPVSQQTEDLSFPFGGYWRGTAEDLIEGDGVRLDTTGPCLLVVAVGDAGDLVLADRSVHVARVFADAFARPVEGMSADDGLHGRRLQPGDPVWIRL